MKHTSLTFTWIKLWKRPEVNRELIQFLTFMNNVKVYPSLDGMATSGLISFSSTTELASQNILDFLRPLKSSLFEKNPNNTRKNMKSQI